MRKDHDYDLRCTIIYHRERVTGKLEPALVEVLELDDYSLGDAEDELDFCVVLSSGAFGL